MIELLQLRDQQQQDERISLRLEVREQLGHCLHRLMAGHRIWLFGSLLQPGTFNAASDIDLAIETLPTGMSIYTLTALLEEDMQRPVDVVELPNSRLRRKIMATGETWIA